MVKGRPLLADGLCHSCVCLCVILILRPVSFPCLTRESITDCPIKSGNDTAGRRARTCDLFLLNHNVVDVDVAFQVILFMEKINKDTVNT